MSLVPSDDEATEYQSKLGALLRVQTNSCPISDVAPQATAISRANAGDEGVVTFLLAKVFIAISITFKESPNPTSRLAANN
jgi:hypothetical protein